MARFSIQTSLKLALPRYALVATLLAVLAVADSAAGRTVNLSNSRFPRERAAILTSEHQRDFPNLKDNFEVTAPSDGNYNCIAHSLGLHDRWINPELGAADNRLSAMDRMYAGRGFHRASRLDFSLTGGKRKVVVYAQIQNGKIVKITHAAVQMTDGTWTSKLGKLGLIRHDSPQALVGPTYGVPVAVYEAGH